ncbi:magnesium/cobalt transporter CorA [Adhaeretor mobilis]|uniref:Magnesium transport protein CorA n=1 Tax=Adhaeretor mobilis TaxID=1930276 RepID=A0A517MU41_9BACT|nr:magnesium/cobalt transporter CorA [Adhaeretor mobilis]QDS98400.1 Magnesium transport protein CorA [Adhaeretor mobilis]
MAILKRDPNKKKRRWRLRHRVKPNTRPGTIIVPEKAAPTRLHATAYGPDEIVEKLDCTVAQIKKLIGKYPVLWIDAVGLKEESVIRELGELLKLHPLSLEDMSNIPQRPKIEGYPNHLFAVAHTTTYKKSLAISQVSFFAGEGFVVSWRERTNDCFDFLRKRLEVKGGTTRSSGEDYLLYALMDAVIDTYFPALESFGDKLDDLDDRVEAGHSGDIVKDIHATRHEIRLLRRIVWPLRDAVDGLMRKHDWLIGEEAIIHFRDCHDHVVQVLDALESYRDACSDVRDHYATAVSNRMNETMRFLTIISTIFIPLGFLAGLYGMNFNPEASKLNMPELNWPWGYPIALGLMGTIALGQVYYFWRRGWLGGNGEKPKNASPQQMKPPNK